MYNLAHSLDSLAIVFLCFFLTYYLKLRGGKYGSAKLPLGKNIPEVTLVMIIQSISIVTGDLAVSRLHVNRDGFAFCQSSRKRGFFFFFFFFGGGRGVIISQLLEHVTFSQTFRGSILCQATLFPTDCPPPPLLRTIM